MTNQDAAKLVSIFAATWPNHPIPDPEALVKAWELALMDIPFPEAERAALLFLQTGKFFPAPAEIRALCPQTGLNAELYKRYAMLRRLAADGEWSILHEQELANIEREIGVPRTARVAAMRELAG